MTVLEQQAFLKDLAKGIVALFGPSCEVAIHDFSKGFENTIVAIENGHVTGRSVGDGASEVVLQTLSSGKAHPENMLAYPAHTRDGRQIHSSSIYLKDKNGQAIGLFGINFDVTDLMMAKHTLENLVSHTLPEREQRPGTAIVTNVNELLDQLIQEADAEVAKPISMLNKEDKIRAIQYLHQKGAFLIKKAGDKISQHYNISKYTLYNYIDASAEG